MCDSDVIGGCLPGDLDSRPDSSAAIDKSSPCLILGLRGLMDDGQALNHCGMCTFRALNKRRVQSDSAIKIIYSSSSRCEKLIKRCRSL